ncbi:hypothetical protein B0H14DRAFT_3505757 [Mycena olivaceomarginata]|nr:hypothetical protein B0H14DRAFT_3505757 [Mycena olivaceomarginata]
MKFLEGGCLVGADKSSYDKYHLVYVFGENLSYAGGHTAHVNQVGIALRP